MRGFYPRFSTRGDDCPGVWYYGTDVPIPLERFLLPLVGPILSIAGEDRKGFLRRSVHRLQRCPYWGYHVVAYFQAAIKGVPPQFRRIKVRSSSRLRLPI